MAVRTGTSSRVSGFRDMVALIYLISFFYKQFGVMSIIGFHAILVVDNYQIAVGAFIAGEGYGSAIRGVYIRFHRTCQVDSIMVSAPARSKW